MNSWIYKMGLLVVLSTFLLSCKGEFEKVRASGDAQFILAKANDYFAKGQFLKAQTLYEQILTSFRGKAESEGMYINYAQTHFELGNFIMAAFYYESFTTNFASSPRVQDAAYKAAYCNFLLSPEPALDQQYTLKAIEGFEEYANRYPESDRIPEINRNIDAMRKKLEQKAFKTCKLYYDMKIYTSANRSFKNLLLEFPETQRADEIKYLIIKSSYLMAKNSVLSKQEERYEEVIKDYTTYKNKIKNSKYSNEINAMIKESELRLNYLRNG
jgi:outer membrane protein assembly factor BamD